MDEYELELCDWQDGEMTCVREANHKGKHWTWSAGPTGFQVFERALHKDHGLSYRPLYSAQTAGQFTRQEVAAVVQYFEYMAKRRKRGKK